jgi:hypothetical protein
VVRAKLAHSRSEVVNLSPSSSRTKGSKLVAAE